MLWIFLKKTNTTVFLFKYKEELSCIHRDSKPPHIDIFDLENWYRTRKRNKIFKKLKGVSLRHFKSKFLPKTYIWIRRRRRRIRKFFFRFLKKRRRWMMQDKNILMKFKERYARCFKNKLDTTKLLGSALSVSRTYERLANSSDRRYEPIKSFRIRNSNKFDENLDHMSNFNKILPNSNVRVGGLIDRGVRKRRPNKVKKSKYFGNKRKGKVIHENRVFFNKNKPNFFFLKKKH